MISFNEALNNYYEFKTLYETSYKKEKRDIINNKKLSWNEKRSKFEKLKPKCINCKRPVGTLFSRKFTNDSSREFKTLLAVCGDRVKPCKLNINLKLENVETLEDNIKDLDKTYKHWIYYRKNNLLYDAKRLLFDNLPIKIVQGMNLDVFVHGSNHFKYLGIGHKHLVYQLVTSTDQFDGLQHGVCKIAVKCFCNPASFGIRLFRKSND